MEVATKRGKAVNRTDLLALVNGQYAGDPKALINLLAADLLEEVQTNFRGKSPMLVMTSLLASLYAK